MKKKILTLVIIAAGIMFMCLKSDMRLVNSLQEANHILVCALLGLIAGLPLLFGFFHKWNEVDWNALYTGLIASNIICAGILVSRKIIDCESAESPLWIVGSIGSLGWYYVASGTLWFLYLLYEDAKKPCTLNTDDLREIYDIYE